MDGTPQARPAALAGDSQLHEALIVGTGFSGMAVAIALKKAGIDDFLMLERASEVGGTWQANTYPGCACDIPSHLYSFSFAQNARWSRKYPSQPELFAYLRQVADRFRLRPHIRFGHTVTGAHFDEASGSWRVETAQGMFRAKVLVSAGGGLSEPSIPALPGLERFTGKTMHSALWDQGYALAGKRVAVIGTGASAIQIVPAIAPMVDKLTLFQRTPPWVNPRNDRAITGFEKFLLAYVKPLQWLYRAKIFLQHEWRMLFFSNAKLMQLGHAAALKHMHAAIPDAQLRARLTPNYVMGCKRALVSDDYYPALTRPNVQLSTAGIREITEDAVIGQDGARHPVDCIVFGTGFQVTDNPMTKLIHGRGGVTLAQAWNQDGEASYLGVLVKHFPNLFMLVGPNSGTGHNSIVYVCEQQARYILRLLKLMKKQGAKTLEVKPEVQDGFFHWAQAWFKKSVWGSGCKSWYQNRQGSIVAIWPGYSYQLKNRLAQFKPDDYLLDHQPPPHADRHA